MESTTESKELQKTEDTSNVVEEVSTEVELEDCTDNSESESEAVDELPKNQIQNAEAEAEAATKTVDIEKPAVEHEVIAAVDENNSEAAVNVSDDNDVVETVNVPKQMEIVIESEQKAFNNVAPTPTTAAATTPATAAATATTPATAAAAATATATAAAAVVSAQQHVAECKLAVVNDNEIVNAATAAADEIVVERVEVAQKHVSSVDDVVETKQVELSENADTTTAALPVKTENAQDQVDTLQTVQSKGENWNNTIKDIISDIDLNIEQENCDLLKQQQKELLQKQQELVEQIRQQQLIAQKLANENQLHRQQLQQQQQQLQSQPAFPPQLKTQTLTSIFEQKPTTTPTPTQQQENISKYTTVEETKDEFGYTQNKKTYEYKESSNATKNIDLHKIFTPATDSDGVLPRNRKLYSSSAFYSPALHPTVEDQVELARRISHSLSDISNQKSKGQSMYVNRKKRSVKWVHEGAGQDYQQQQQQQQFKPATSPSILPAYSDAGKHRVQLNLHQEQVLEKYVKPGLKVVKTPWEAALETGSASTAFIDDDRRRQQTATPALSPAPYAQYAYTDNNNVDNTAYNNGYTADYSIAAAPTQAQSQAYIPTIKPSFGHNPQRELAYKPSLPQGWKAPSPSLPKELYLPKEISLESYAPPPVVNTKEAEHFKPTWQQTTTTPTQSSTSSFPLARPNHAGFRSYGQTPNQYSRPVQQQQHTTQIVPQMNYNPSPLPYDKIAKFENSQTTTNNEYITQMRPLTVKSHVDKVQNMQHTAYRAQQPTAAVNAPYQTNLRTNEMNYNRAVTPVYTKRINPNELLHGQNYNNTARGWRSSDNCGYNNFKTHNIDYQQQMPLAAAANTLPYTDF